MSNHTPTFTSSAASGSFSENANTTGSTAAHLLSGTMNFKDSDKSDSHTTSASLHNVVWSGGSVVPSVTLTDLANAMSSTITSDSNGSGSLKWSFSAPDDDFDFLAKNQTLVLTYDISVTDNHGAVAKQTVTVTITGTDDKPVINIVPVTTVTEQFGHILSLTPDTAHIIVPFVDADLTNVGQTATVVGVSATGGTEGLLPGVLGTIELAAFFQVDSVVKSAGSSSGTINTTFSAPDLAFDYLASGEHLNITYTLQVDDHAGGVTTQNVIVTVVGTNDAPIYLSGPESAHLVEGQHLSPGGNLTANGDLIFTDVDLLDTHTVSTTVNAVRSGGGSVPLTNANLLAAMSTSLVDSTGHLLGDVDWNFSLPNSETNFLSGGETLTLTYNIKVTDPAHASDTETVTITILGTNHPVVITSGPESASLTELTDTTGSSTVDTTTPVPTGSLAFTDQDTSDTHAVAVSLGTVTWSGGSGVPAATQTDLATALATTLHDSTGSGAGSVDWTFSIPDKDLDFLAAGETLTVDYNVKVSDASTNATQTVAVTITGANDAPVISDGPQSASVAEQPNVTGSSTPDTTSPVPTGTLHFTDADLSDTHMVGVSLDSAQWSVDPDFVPIQTLIDLQTALSTTLHDSGGSGSGGVDWTFSIPDKDLDFLSAGETLTATYTVTVADSAASTSQTVTITATGAQDALVANDVTGTLADTPFPDAGVAGVFGNLLTEGTTGSDASASVSVTAINGNAADVGQPIAGLYGTLFVDSLGNYSYVANGAVDPLQAGDTASDHFTFTVMDSLGGTASASLNFSITGADDAPVITGGQLFGSVTEDAGATAAVNGGFETGDLTGWFATPGVSVELLGIGGQFGNYAADLTGSGSLEQDVATTAGQHYSLSFYVAGDPEASSTSFTAYWDGAPVLSETNVPLSFTHYTFDVTGDTVDPTTQFFVDYSSDGTGLLFDTLSVNPTPGPATESASGSVSFSDVETGDTHTASVTSAGSDYVGTFTLDPVSESGGSGSVGWHFTVDNADIQFLAQDQTLTQDYFVSITDNNGASTTQDVSVTLNGANDPPTAVGETVVTDVGPNGTVDVPTWALGANDTDPDTTDVVTPNAIVSSSGGGAVLFGDAFFTDDSTLGGSFDYTVTDGHVTSSNTATATIVNNSTGATTLTGTSGDDIVIASNGSESLNGGGGNDVLIADSGSHAITGGAGSDIFGFVSVPDGTDTITDFNNTTQADTIAISAAAFGGGLTPHQDLTFDFETTNDNQFSGFAQFHFDTANQTLYYSADYTQTSAVAVVQVQAGVTLHPNDLLVV